MATTRLTPEEAQALVDRIGSKRGAARHLGIPLSTFLYWLDPEKVRERRARDYAADPEKKREAVRAYYLQLNSLQYNKRLLNCRRSKAIRRMREREEARGSI